jgi:hypothetical protein
MGSIVGTRFSFGQHSHPFIKIGKSESDSGHEETLNIDQAFYVKEFVAFYLYNVSESSPWDLAERSQVGTLRTSQIRTALYKIATIGGNTACVIPWPGPASQAPIALAGQSITSTTFSHFGCCGLRGSTKARTTQLIRTEKPKLIRTRSPLRSRFII